MTWIVGKNASVLTFPKDFFVGKQSIGMNHAAMELHTDMAFSAYPYIIKQYLANGFTLDKIIGVSPICSTLQGQYNNELWPNLYPGILNDPVKYDNNLCGVFSEIVNEAHLAMAKDFSRIYHNRGTALHLLIIWCVLHGRYPIRLCGCNQTRPCMSGKDEYPDQSAQQASREYTAEMIRCFNLHGDIVRLYENYDDCLEKEKYYASLCSPEK